MQETITLFQHGLWLAVVMSAPPLIVATLLGVSVSLLQAITQVQVSRSHWQCSDAGSLSN